MVTKVTFMKRVINHITRCYVLPMLAAFCIGAALTHAVAAQTATPVKPKIQVAIPSAKHLDETATYFQEFAEKRLLDDDGLVRAWISPLTLRPFTIVELSPMYDKYMRDICQNAADPAGAVTYENSLMATGEFAMSQIVRYQKTESKEALLLARKAVRGILAVSREGENCMPGFLPKPHGGLARARYSHEMSPDQYTKAIAALDLWLPYAAPEERDEILRFYKNCTYFLYFLLVYTGGWLSLVHNIV